jgi:YD repeat-containing protein
MQAGNKGARFLLVVLLSAIATAADAGETVIYSYDALGRLVSSTSSGTGLATTIAYDPAGNRQTYGVATGGGGTPILIDGSFENPPQNGGYSYDPVVTGVAFSGGAGIQGNGSAWAFANAPDGSQTGFLQSYGGSGGSIAFTVSGLTAGTSYQARFSMARRPNWGTATVTVSFNGVAVGSFTPGSTAFTPVTTASFTAGTATGTLTFSVPAGPGDSSLAIDAVSLAAGPSVPDFSFEAPAQNGGWTYNPTVTGVTFTGRAGVQGNGSAFAFSNAPEGSQTGVMQTYGGAGGSIAFALSGLTPGSAYRASFFLAQRPGYGAETVTVSFDGVAAGSFTTGSTAFTQVTTTSFTASAAIGTLTFSVPAGAGDVSAAIDSVALVPGS